MGVQFHCHSSLSCNQLSEEEIAWFAVILFEALEKLGAPVDSNVLQIWRLR